MTIGYLNNEENIDWKNKVGNLTGNASGANSIVWYAPGRYILGAWIDGTDTWAGISNDFGGDDWTLAGCGDFDGACKDDLLVKQNSTATLGYYSEGILDSNHWNEMGFAPNELTVIA